VDFVTVAAEGALLEDWLGGTEIIPVARTISAMLSVSAIPVIRSFRGRIIGNAPLDDDLDFVEPKSVKQVSSCSKIGLLELSIANTILCVHKAWSNL
jgi:hypothetical protein